MIGVRSVLLSFMIHVSILLGLSNHFYKAPSINFSTSKTIDLQIMSATNFSETISTEQQVVESKKPRLLKLETAQQSISSAPSEATSSTVVNLPPGYINNPAPEYPEQARIAGQEGTVLLRVNISASGEPTKVEVIKSSEIYILDNAALEAVRVWKFIPARNQIGETSSEVEIPIVFRLH